jgi:hypothetical protein
MWDDVQRLLAFQGDVPMEVRHLITNAQLLAPE